MSLGAAADLVALGLAPEMGDRNDGPVDDAATEAVRVAAGSATSTATDEAQMQSAMHLSLSSGVSYDRDQSVTTGDMNGAPTARVGVL